MKRYLFFLMLLCFFHSGFAQSSDLHASFNQMIKQVQAEAEKNLRQNYQLVANTTNQYIYALYLNGKKVGYCASEKECKDRIREVERIKENTLAKIPKNVANSAEATQFRNELKNNFRTTYRKETNPNYRRSENSDSGEGGYAPSVGGGSSPQTPATGNAPQTPPARSSVFSTDTYSQSDDMTQAPKTDSPPPLRTSSPRTTNNPQPSNGVRYYGEKKPDLTNYNIIKPGEDVAMAPDMDYDFTSANEEDYMIRRSLAGHTDEVVGYDIDAWNRREMAKYRPLYEFSVEEAKKAPPTFTDDIIELAGAGIPAIGAVVIVSGTRIYETGDLSAEQLKQDISKVANGVRATNETIVEEVIITAIDAGKSKFTQKIDEIRDAVIDVIPDNHLTKTTKSAGEYYEDQSKTFSGMYLFQKNAPEELSHAAITSNSSVANRTIDNLNSNTEQAANKTLKNAKKGIETIIGKDPYVEEIERKIHAVNDVENNMNRVKSVASKLNEKYEILETNRKSFSE